MTAAMSDGKDGAEESGADRKKRSQSHQYLACFVVNILAIVSGSTYGWMAPILPQLQSEHSPVDIPSLSDTEISWLASIPSIPRLFTIPLYGYAIDRLGRKAAGYLVAAPFIIGWAMLLFANSMSMLFWARFIIGMAYGGITLFVPSYTIDIAEDNIKGRLGVLYGMSLSLGCTFAYTMGSYTSYMVFHVSNILLSIIFVAAFFWMPESPLTLMTKGKTGEAKEALRWLRNGEDSELEFKRIQFRSQEILEERKRKISLKIITERCTWRALLICVGLTLNQQLSGPSPITSYTLTIFQESSTTIPASVATILIGALQTIGSFLSSVAIEKSGRRFLLFSSDIVMATCLFILGIYMYLRSLGWDLEIVGWIPVVCLSIYILGFGLALVPLPTVLVTEMVTPQARNLVQGVGSVVLGLGTFVMTASFMPLVGLIGHHGCFFLYGSACVVSVVCIFFTVPETKNRSIEDVVEQLKRDDYIRSVLRGQAETRSDVKQQC